jgi:hypothetical protein
MPSTCQPPVTAVWLLLSTVPGGFAAAVARTASLASRGRPDRPGPDSGGSAAPDRSRADRCGRPSAMPLTPQAQAGGFGGTLLHSASLLRPFLPARRRPCRTAARRHHVCRATRSACWLCSPPPAAPVATAWDLWPNLTAVTTRTAGPTRERLFRPGVPPRKLPCPDPRSLLSAGGRPGDRGPASRSTAAAVGPRRLLRVRAARGCRPA